MRTVLFWPSERDGRSKVLGSDDSMPLATCILPWFAAVLEILAEGAPEDNIFDFSDQDVVKKFNRCR